MGSLRKRLSEEACRKSLALFRCFHGESGKCVRNWRSTGKVLCLEAGKNEVDRKVKLIKMDLSFILAKTEGRLCCLVLSNVLKKSYRVTVYFLFLL